MPKRRGKSTAAVSRRSEHPPLASIEQFLQRLQREPAVSGNRPLDPAAWSDADPEVPGLDTTLSPDQRTPPPPPLSASSPREGSGLEAAALPDREAVTPGSQQGEVSMAFLSPETVPADRRSEGGEKTDWQTEGSQGEPFSTLHEPSFKYEKPAEITLDSLWDLVSKLGDSLTKQIKEGEKNIRIQKQIEENKQEISNIKEKVGEIEKEVIMIKQVQSTIIKDNQVIRRKLETMENNYRTNNLHLLNFPKVPSINPREMIKRYFIEILNIPEESIPPLTRVYYLPIKVMDQQVEDQKQVVQDPQLDLTTILEVSDKDLAKPATLLLSVELLPDKDWILKMFFKNKNKEFLGLKIQMFPDVSRETQNRRRQFLLMKAGVTQLGGIFFLRFPCKCIIRYRDNKYVFFEPAQLTAFLTLKRLEKEGTT
uniref:Uncharacterized protein LOC117366574 n=1 Tax=Geotrypetes seraphini TaxID=260995 RepID=A0A6P8SAY8_GEOSA|nr:uncharacterized protein LOC117366574 [Geotrypetes seraphini]